MPYWNELLGGLLIGVASALPLLFDGRQAGVSGFASSALRPLKREGQMGLLFVIGLIVGGFIWKQSGETHPDSWIYFKNPERLWALAGFLVGIGARMGGGCTSGHGICGIGRLSKRSIVATIIFMAAGGVTVFIMEFVAWSA